MKLVCHIGTPKTASTLLQNTCASNSDWLRKNGVIYPELLSRNPNHLTLFYAANERMHDFTRDYGLKTREDVLRFRGKLSKSLSGEIAKAPKNAHTMVLSSENLTGNLHGPKSVQNFGRLLKPHFDEIKIVIYLRRQDDAILSMYGEHLRMGFSGMSWPEFITASLSARGPTPYLYYRRVLSTWIETFGKESLDVRIFDKDRLIGGDILADFMSAVFESDVPDLTQVQPSDEDNIGLSAPVLEFLYQMHPYIPRRKNGERNMRREQLTDRINALPSKPRPRMDPEHSQKIMKHFEPANTWVRNTFFTDLDGPLFADREPRKEESNIGKITIEQFAEYAGKLFT